jgi:hypothetical protein
MFIKLKKANARMGHSVEAWAKGIPELAHAAMISYVFNGSARLQGHWCKARVYHDTDCCC